MASNIWDAALTEEESRDFPVLPAGRYTFQVEKVTGKEYLPKPTSKIKRCAQLDLQLRVEGDIDVKVFESLFGDPSTIWKMTQFAKCIGVYHKGMTPGELLRSAQDGIGEAEVIVETYNGKQRNRVKTYYPKAEQPKAPVITSEDLPF